MKKSEILELDNEELLAYLLRLESVMNYEANSRGITKSTVKMYKWTVEELCKRFNLNLNKFVSLTGNENWWGFDEEGNS